MKNKDKDKMKKLTIDCYEVDVKMLVRKRGSQSKKYVKDEAHNHLCDCSMDIEEIEVKVK